MPYPRKDATFAERREWLAQRRATMAKLRGRELTDEERLRNICRAMAEWRCSTCGATITDDCPCGADGRAAE